MGLPVAAVKADPGAGDQADAVMVAAVAEKLQRIVTVGDQLPQDPCRSAPDIVVPPLDRIPPQVGHSTGIENRPMGPGREQHQGVHTASCQLVGDGAVIFRGDRRLEAVQSSDVATVVEEEDTWRGAGVPAFRCGA